MEFRNSFTVEGSPADVIAVFGDTPLVAGFLPGASVGERRDDGSHPGVLAVSFGPKRLNFKGSLVNDARPQELAGTLTGQASSDVRGAKMAVTLDYRLSAAPGGTRVDTVAEAELTGVLAEFARTGGAVVTQALLDAFAQRLSAHMRATRPAAVADTAAPLSGLGLLLRILKSMFVRRRRDA